MSITQAAIDAGIIVGEIVTGSAGTALPEGMALRTRYIDPENPANVYDGGILPEWMRTKMAEQGYDPNAPADREAFKANYLSGPVRGRRRAAPQPLTDAERTRAEEDAWIAEHNPELAASIAEIERAGTALVTAGPGTALIPAEAMDGEWIAAASRTEILVMEMHSIIRQEIECRVYSGDILLELYKLCREDGHLTDRWSALLDGFGMTHDTAKKRMYVARAVRKLPALRDLAQRSWTKALTLVESVNTEQLTEITDGSYADLTLDDVDKMSVSKLKDELRRYKTDTKRIVAEETKTLRSENDAMRDDLAQAHAALDGDVAQARKTARALREVVQTLAETADRLIDQLAPLPSGDLRGLRLDLESCISSGSIRLKDLWANWQDRVLDLGLDD